MGRLETSRTAADHAPAEPLADDASARIDGGRPGADTGQTRSLSVAFTGLALAFFLVPLLLILTGQAGHPLPAEHPVGAPRLGQGWTFFDDASQYLTQQLPLRAQAVTAYNSISENVFGTAPRYGTALAGGSQPLPFATVNQTRGGYAQTGGAKAGHPLVAIGRDGWYFLQGELDTVCAPPVAFTTAIERWVNFIQTIRASGRNVVLEIVPEKSTIYPEHVAPNTISWPCARRQKARLWSQIESVRSPDFAPLRHPLLRLKRRDPKRLLYLPLDSHWNDLGGLLLVQDALRHVGGGVQVAPGDVHVSTKPYTGDITRLTGTARSGVAPAVSIRRAGEGPVATVSTAFGVRVTTHPGGPGGVIPGTTLFLHDSYGDAPAPLLTHYAGRLIEAGWLFATPAQIAQLIRQAHTVIIETVERDFLNRSALGLPQTVLSPSFLQSLPKVLAGAQGSG